MAIQAWNRLFDHWRVDGAVLCDMLRYYGNSVCADSYGWWLDSNKQKRRGNQRRKNSQELSERRWAEVDFWGFFSLQEVFCFLFQLHLEHILLFPWFSSFSSSSQSSLFKESLGFVYEAKTTHLGPLFQFFYFQRNYRQLQTLRNVFIVMICLSLELFIRNALQLEIDIFAFSFFLFSSYSFICIYSLSNIFINEEKLSSHQIKEKTNPAFVLK